MELLSPHVVYNISEFMTVCSHCKLRKGLDTLWQGHQEPETQFCTRPSTYSQTGVFQVPTEKHPFIETGALCPDTALTRRLKPALAAAAQRNTAYGRPAWICVSAPVLCCCTYVMLSCSYYCLTCSFSALSEGQPLTPAY